jgi:hypothetical protein
LTGGVLFASFGVLPALAAAAAGGLLGYVFERRAEKRHAGQSN